MNISIRQLPTVFWCVLMVSFLLIIGGGSIANAASPAPAQTYYLPLSEDNMYAGLFALRSDISSTIHSENSIVITSDNTIIYYDHWELTGYETVVNSPVQASTEIWGDANAVNGFPPGFPSDVIGAGDVISLTADIAVPRDDSDQYYDGMDKIASTKAIAITRAGWAEPNHSSLLADAVAVIDQANWGIAYELPIGEDLTSSSMYEYVGAEIAAGVDGTVVNIDEDNDTVIDTTVSLDEGETYYVDGGLLLGATITSSSPVQVYLQTGDVEDSYESRWYSMVPTSAWSNEYYNPVATTDPAELTTLFVYNPNASPITIDYDRASPLSGGSFVVGAGATSCFAMPYDAGTTSGVRIASSGGESFLAVAAIEAYDCSTTDNSNHRTNDWGFTLVPSESMTDLLVVGSGRATLDYTTPTGYGSPVWVISGSDTTLRLDYDGDATTGALTDINGNQYDVDLPISAYESLRIQDNGDNDMTGAKIYTTDGTDITGAWGQDPSDSGAGLPYLDIGTVILPYPQFTVTKDAIIDPVDDTDGNGEANPGEALTYTIATTNTGPVILGNIVVNDAIVTNTTYVPGSSQYRVDTDCDGSIDSTTAIPDNSGGGTDFPLDDDGFNTPGYNVGNIDSGDCVLVDFKLLIDNPLPVGVTTLSNTATVETDEGPLDVTIVVEADVFSTIDGVVWKDDDEDAVIDGPETFFAGVTINLYTDDGDGIFEPGAGDVLYGTDTTDGTGYYSFEDVPSDVGYWVDVTDTGAVLAGHSHTNFTDPSEVVTDAGSDHSVDFGYQLNNPPVAVDDAETTDKNTPKDIVVIDDDSDPDPADTIYISDNDDTSTEGGTIIFDDKDTPGDPSDDTLLYTPPFGFSGIDTFEYTICDNHGECDTATVTVTILDNDTDGDGVPDTVEDEEDEDGDGIPNNEDYDPTGYFYCQDDGRILSGGLITASGPGAVTIVEDGSNGYYQLFTDGTPGIYTLEITYPENVGSPSTTRLVSSTPIDPTGFSDPFHVGSGEDASTGILADFSAGANPFYDQFDLEDGDPDIQGNNIPMQGCVLADTGTPITFAMFAGTTLLGSPYILYKKTGRVKEETTININPLSLSFRKKILMSAGMLFMLLISRGRS